MADFRIPDDLVQLLGQRRIIPFVGAGFSAVHRVPNWEDLLSALAAEIQAASDVDPMLSYEEIADACGNDNLQIAEYLYLIAGESIGPIRHSLSTSLQTTTPLLKSTPHVELVNLGAPHVYTTNFDDLIEKTYRELGLQVDVIALPRDMALSHADRTEVVKYHGDLRHEQTLVLTESQYYTRLEFESPMDLKFRSDLLGRSVLFMGYSFRDINIRVIWFRLMQMMQDVPLKDRPPSYIVRLRANPVLDALYGAVGLRTLVIDPKGSANSDAEKNALLSEFLMELSLRSSPDGKIPGSSHRAFVSAGLVEQAERQLNDASGQGPEQRPRVIRFSGGRVFRRPPRVKDDIIAPTPLLAAIDRLTARQLTPFVHGQVGGFLLRLARAVNTVASRASLGAQLAAWFVPEAGPAPGVTLLVARSLLSTSSREVLYSLEDLPWETVWAAKLEVGDLRKLLNVVEAEVEGHEEEEYTDDDLAFAIDFAMRVASGALVEGAGDGEEDEEDEEVREIRAKADSLVKRSASLYPAVDEYEADTGSAPNPADIQTEIEDRAQALEAGEEEEEEVEF